MTEPDPHRPQQPATPQDWRDLLRHQELPDADELPRRQRRRARRHWRSAQREARAQWLRRQRAQTPTGIHIPIIALVLAIAIAVATWLMPQHLHHNTRAASPAPSTAAPPAAGDPVSSTTPSTAASPQPSTTALLTAQQVATGFATGYCTRMPLQDGSAAAAVKRASAYASGPLIVNLLNTDDHDFDVLVSRQATSAKPTKVTVTEPTAAQRPAPDTPLRVYLQATAQIQVTGTYDYSYQRTLTLEVSRADTGDPWMVTRVLGLAQ